MLAGEAASNAYVSICVPLRVTAGKPTVVAPMLIRPIAPSTADVAAQRGALVGASAAALVLEAGTDQLIIRSEGSPDGATEAEGAWAEVVLPF